MKHLKLISALTLATAALLAGPVLTTAADSESTERPQVRAQSERASNKAETAQRGQRQRLQQCEVPCCENRQVQRQAMREGRQRQAGDGRRQGLRGEGRGPRS